MVLPKFDVGDTAVVILPNLCWDGRRVTVIEAHSEKLLFPYRVQFDSGYSFVVGRDEIYLTAVV